MSVPTKNQGRLLFEWTERNPSTGKNEFYGEFLINAQGEDVVAGIRTPLPFSEMKKWNKNVHKQLLAKQNRFRHHSPSIAQRGCFCTETQNGTFIFNLLSVLRGLSMQQTVERI